MKKYFIIMLFLILSILPFKVGAATVTLSLECPANAKAGASVVCTLSVKQTGGVSAVKGNFNLGGTTYKSFDKKGSYDISTVDQNGFLFGKTDGFSSSLTLGTLNVTIPSSAAPGDSFTIKITNVSATDLEYNDISHKDVSDTIKIKSNVNTLSSLSIAGAEISFSETTLNYSATVDADSTTITAKAKDSSASVSGAGNKTLKYGKNEFKVVVTAEDGSKKTYTLTITRPDNRNTNNYLKSLSVDVGTISFNKDTTIYNINVEADVKTAKISAEVEDSKASFVKNYGARSVTLKYGKNEILVKVSAENEKVKTYTINITRKDDRSSDNTLSSLTVSPGSINFNKNTTEYYVNVDDSVTEIKIDATASDSKATIKIEKPKKLVSGENKYKVIVTAENEKTKTYTIIVTKGNAQTTPSEDPGNNQLQSNNNTAKNISVKGYDVDFSSDKTEYKIKTNDKSLDLDIELEESTATYKVIGNENLSAGSEVKIVVTAENGQEKTYTIKIVGNELSTLQIALAGGVMLAIIIVIVMLIRSKSKAS